MIATVVIPTYNQKPHFLAEAIESAKAQTVPVEVLVVDDGSEKPIPEGEGYRVVRHEKNCGIAAALNTGIREMATDWFCWLSSDDLIHRHKVELQFRFLANVDGKAGWHRYYAGGQEMGPTPWTTKKTQDRMLYTGCRINGSTVMVHRSVFDDVGVFDTTYDYGQDWEMWCRIGLSYFWHGMDEVLGTRREEGNLTSRIQRTGHMRRQKEAEDRRIIQTYAHRAAE